MAIVNQKKNRGSPNYSVAKISSDIETDPGDMRIHTVTQTSVKNLTGLKKKKWNNDSADSKMKIK